MVGFLIFRLFVPFFFIFSAFVITTAFNYVYKYVYSKKTAVRFATFSLRKEAIEKKKRKKEETCTETVKSPRIQVITAQLNGNLNNYLN